MAAETVVGVVVVSATFTSTREVVASHGTIKTHGTAHMAEVEIMEDGDTTNLRTIPTLPQTKLRAIPTEGTRRRPKTTIRTTNRAGTEDRLSRRMNHDLRINSHPMEVVEEGTIQDMMARTAAERMGTPEGEVALLPIEEVRRTVVRGTTIKEVKEGDMGMVVTVADTTSPHRTAAAAEVVTAEAVVTILVEAIHPADRTAPVSSPTAGTEEVTTREAEAVGEGTDHRDVQTRILWGVAFRFVSSMLSSCFQLTLIPFGGIHIVILSIYYVPKHHM